MLPAQWEWSSHWQQGWEALCLPGRWSAVTTWMAGMLGCTCRDINTCTPIQTSHAHPYFISSEELPGTGRASILNGPGCCSQSETDPSTCITMFGVTALAVCNLVMCTKGRSLFPSNSSKSQLCPQSRFGSVTLRVGRLCSAADRLFPEAGTLVWVDVTAGTCCFDSSSEKA